MTKVFLTLKEQAALQQMGPRDLQLGDRLLLPGAYPSVNSFPINKCYLSGPITWMTDMSRFRSGHGEQGEMVVHVTDDGWAEQIHYDFYGIDFVVLYVKRG